MRTSKDNKAFLEALRELEEEKGMDKDELINSIENALHVAYKKQYKDSDNSIVNINRKTGDVKIYAKKIVVENVENKNLEIDLEEAKVFKKTAKIGDEILIEQDAENFKRTAIQNAKQVVIQKVREFEKYSIYRAFKKIEHTVVLADVQKTDENGNLHIEINGLEAIVPSRELTPTDVYEQGDKVAVYIGSVEEGSKFNRVLISRKSPELIKKLFEREIPEIESGLIEIKSIARDAGSRTKIAVYTEDKNLDLKGACIGRNGSRISTIINELNGEKLDIVEWNEDIRIFVKNALSPAEIKSIEIVKIEGDVVAKVEVSPEEFSVAIGKKGQNTKLASKLCDIKIEVIVEEVLTENENEIIGNDGDE